jgi:hypothetical protein
MSYWLLFTVTDGTSIHKENLRVRGLGDRFWNPLTQDKYQRQERVKQARQALQQASSSFSSSVNFNSQDKDTNNTLKISNVSVFKNTCVDVGGRLSVNNLKDARLLGLAKDIPKVLLAAHTVSTNKTYHGHFLRWKKWCNDINGVTAPHYKSFTCCTFSHRNGERF